MQKLLPHSLLDRLLATAAAYPEAFPERAHVLAARLDAEGIDLEVSDPQEWRRGTPAQRTSFAQQFRADVEAILPLNRVEEGRLARRIEFARIRLEIARDGAAQDRKVRRATELHALRSEMVERNLYLVLINVERFSHAHGSRMDLIQEGCAALFRAVDGFDWRRGLLFRTYAVHWLYQAFRNYLYNNGHTVRVPVYLQKAMKGIRQAAARLGDEQASADMIAAAADMDSDLVTTALASARSTYSMDADLGSSPSSVRLRDVLVDRSRMDPYLPEFEDVSLDSGLKRALSDLNSREHLVLRLRFGIGEEREHTLAEVATRLGVSVERVRQIQVRALHKLNTPTLRRELEPFLN